MVSLVVLPANFWRYGIVAALLLLLGWLAASPPPTAAKWAAISQELKRGTMGQLPPADKKLLHQTLAWLLPQAGVTDRFILNSSPQPGKGLLHVYTTTPAALAATGCARGNALYDAQLDAIFIDEQIIRPEEFTQLGSDGPNLVLSLNEFSFVPVYLRFILLHELGHRQLHGRSGGAFYDINLGSRQIEQEADNFAVTKLKRAYAADFAAGGHRIGLGAARYIQLDPAGLSQAERVWADLIGAVSSMSVELMFSASDFSSFYEDTAHPNFIRRATAILDAALEAREPSIALKARAAIYRRYLRRMQSLALAKFVELQLPQGVQRVTFEDGRLLALTDSGGIFTATLNQVNQTLQQTGRPLPLQLTSLRDRRHAASSEDVYRSKLWSHPNLGLVWVQPSEIDSITKVFTAHGNEIIALPTLERVLNRLGGTEVLFEYSRPWWKGIPDYDTNLFLPPQPAAAAIVQTAASSVRDELLLLREGQLVARLPLDSLSHAIGTRLGVPAAGLTVGTLTDSVAHLTVFQRSGSHDQLIGAAELDLLTGQVGRVTSLRFEDESGATMSSIPNDKLVAVPVGKQTRYILVTRNRSHFLVFSLSPARPARRVTEREFLFDSVLTQGHINSDVLGNFDPVLTDARFVNPSFVLATFFNDSVYLIDVNTGSITNLFSPGNFIKLTTSRHGHVAFYMHNGRKIYLLRPSKTLNSSPTNL